MENKTISQKKISQAIESSLISIGGLAILLSPTIGLISNMMENNDTQEGAINIDHIMIGNIEYKKLKDCYFVQIENSNLNLDEFYICAKNMSKNEENSFKYINIINNEIVFEYSPLNNLPEENGKKLISEIPLSDYLYGFNLKSEYTIGDVEDILEQIKEKKQEQSKKFIKIKLNTIDTIS